MAGPDEPTGREPAAQPPGDEHPDPLDMREEWGAPTIAEEETDPGRDVPPTGAHEAAEMRTRHAAPETELPKKKVRGIARGVNIRSDLQQQQEKLTFRVDRYDVSGNRLAPVPVEMRRYRGGLLTDGDEVEVVGQWSRGTLRASRIRNLTTASDVRSWFAGWSKWVLITMGLVLAIVIAVVAVAVVSSSSGAATVAMPDVVGQNEAAAFAALSHKGLTPDRTTEPSDSPAGTVTRTEPRAGVEVPKNSTVTVVVSSGPAGRALGSGATTPPVTTPPATAPRATASPATAPPPTAPPPTARPVAIGNVAGQLMADAANALRALGLSVTVVQQPSTTVPEGIAIGTDPAAGTTVPAGSVVKLLVSSGKPTTTTT